MPPLALLTRKGAMIVMHDAQTMIDTSKSYFSAQVIIWAAYASAVIAGVGLLFLVIFFSGVAVFGPLNDIAVIFQYLLLIPIMFAIYQMLGSKKRRLNIAALGIGVIGSLAVILLQALLVIGVLPFRQQIVLVIPAFLVAAVWFVLIGHMGRHEERIPKGLALHILAGLVFGYPIWAFRLARNIKEHSKGTAA